MVRSGRYHVLTSAAVCIHLVMRRRRPITDAEVRRVSAEIRRAWAFGERRRAPVNLSEHFDIAPELRDALPSHHRLVDVLPEGASTPQPAVDTKGRSVHAVVRNEHVIHKLCHEGTALVWGTTPAIGMVNLHDTTIVIRPGSRGTCESVTQSQMLAIVQEITSGSKTTPCNMFCF